MGKAARKDFSDILVKQGKIKVHQDVINRLIATYRS